MKGFKRIAVIILAVVSVFAIALFCGCKDNEAEEREYYVNHSKIYSLQQAYESGFLTKEDIKAIGFYTSGEIYQVADDCQDKTNADNWQKLDYTPEQPRPTATPELENDIKSAYYYIYNRMFQDGDVRYGKDILKVTYLGSYNGYYVAQVTSDKWLYPAYIQPISIGDICWPQDPPLADVFYFEK